MDIHKNAISIWFFIGLCLTVYGLLIVAVSAYHLFVPLANPPVLYRLHSGVWWGAILLAAGIVYLLKFRPSRRPGVEGAPDNPTDITQP